MGLFVDKKDKADLEDLAEDHFVENSAYDVHIGNYFSYYRGYYYVITRKSQRTECAAYRDFYVKKEYDVDLPDKMFWVDDSFGLTEKAAAIRHSRQAVRRLVKADRENE